MIRVFFFGKCFTFNSSKRNPNLLLLKKMQVREQSAPVGQRHRERPNEKLVFPSPLALRGGARGARFEGDSVLADLVRVRASDRRHNGRS